jgi:hypothetical protein
MMIEIGAIVFSYVLLLILFIKTDSVANSNAALLKHLDKRSVDIKIPAKPSIIQSSEDVRRILSVLNIRSTADMETVYRGHPCMNSLETLSRDIVNNNEVTLPSGKLVTVQEALVLITDYLDLEVEVTPATKTTSKLIKRNSKDIG